jgi:hypothetical protein
MNIRFQENNAGLADLCFFLHRTRFFQNFPDVIILQPSVSDNQDPVSTNPHHGPLTTDVEPFGSTYRGGS